MLHWRDKKRFNKELEKTKEVTKISKCWICDNDSVDNDVIDHCQITGKYKGSAHRDCNINIKLNHEISVVFHNLKKYFSHIVMQKVGKFSIEINIIRNGLEQYVNFTVNNKLIFIDSFQFLSSSLNSLVENISKDNFKYWRQEFGNNI